MMSFQILKTMDLIQNFTFIFNMSLITLLSIKILLSFGLEVITTPYPTIPLLKTDSESASDSESISYFRL